MSWFAVRRELDPGRSAVLMACSFLAPLVIWAVAAYGPFWPTTRELQLSAESGALDKTYVPGDVVPPEQFDIFANAIREENESIRKARADGQPAASTARSNKKIVRKIFPIALAEGWVTKDQETDDELLKHLWLEIAQGNKTPDKFEFSRENEAVLTANAAVLGAAEDWPEEALLKLVPQARLRYQRPVYLIPPHEVAASLWEGLTETKPTPDPSAAAAESGSDSLTLLQRYGQSLQTIALGFLLAAGIAVPLGILAGTYSLFSRLLEPFTDFFRYMPAPSFGVVLMAIFGLELGPKVMLVFLGTFPHAILMIAKTTRQLEMPLLEAAQTLGANQRQLVTRVVIPGVMPNLYNDLRILLGWAWTWLVIAELLGFKSGLTEIIDTRGRRFQFDQVYPAILLIGLTGFLTDQFLCWLSRGLFPWAHPEASGTSRLFVRILTALPKLARKGVQALWARCAAALAPAPAKTPAVVLPNRQS